MRVILMLIKKEFLQVYRNKLLMSILIVAPLVQFVIFPFTADYEIKVVKIGFIDSDHSSLTRQMVEKFTYSPYFINYGFIESRDQGEALMMQDKVDFIIEFPSHFEKDLMNGLSPQLAITANAINSVKAGIGSGYIKNVISSFFNEQKEGLANRSAQPANVSISKVYWYNEQLNYKNLIVPGILVILVTLIGAYVTALNIVREKEIGTIEQMNVSPIKKWHFLLGKMIPFWILGMVEFIIGLLLMKFIFGISVQGSVGALLLCTSVYLLVMLGLGFFISLVSRNQLQAMFIVFFLFVVFVLMSGLFTPTEGMPQWAKYINYANPMSFFMEIIKLIVMKGAGLMDVMKPLITLFVMSVFINSAALLSYSEKKK
ncbi:MAG: type transporter [Bacteroidetes bacterium]|nr:type transporter [Bacteroidota bacterium]